MSEPKGEDKENKPDCEKCPDCPDQFEDYLS